MIITNISELKNQLSHYLKLVQGGEQIQIMDRKTPKARIVQVSGSSDTGGSPPWLKKMQDLGVIKPPEKKTGRSEFFTLKEAVSMGGKSMGVLDALLDERKTGR